ncbi:MAG: undecaprenyl-diphosphate phosphatase [Gammaproteobacteria bacterium]|nr:undecaprenyl-diphosphate phosphatase [Gammaproteobacteria bacterium]
MELGHAILLGLVQGLTEFLPVSSSAHLILAHVVAGWEDQGLAFDVAVHVGTLAAVVFYFRREVRTLIADWFASLGARAVVGESRLAWWVCIGTVPTAVCGLLLGDFIEANLRSPLVIATTTVLFGLVLWWADRVGARRRDEHSMDLQDALLIGAAQALALIPGTSRSGITITVALFLGLTRVGAARYSFLLSIPIILLAGGAKTYDLVKIGPVVDWAPIALGTMVSAVSAYLCIRVFLALLERVGMLPFVIYRLVLGFALFAAFGFAT